MTGFGKAEANLQGRKIKVEISSVNSRKGLDLGINLPRELVSMEAELREQLQKAVSRGRVGVSVFVDGVNGANGQLRVNRDLLKQYCKEIRLYAKEIGANDEVGMEFLFRLPGVMGDGKSDAEETGLQKKIAETLGVAVAEFQKSREREGRFLCKNLIRQIGALDKIVAGVEKRKDAVLLRFRQNLQKRLREAGLEVPLDDERLVKEIVIFSDRCDISEEVMRLRSHFQEARRLLQTADSIGRNLDFLLQEIGREVNTIGSKANDIEISRRVVELKTELEKIREQVQNLE